MSDIAARQNSAPAAELPPTAAATSFVKPKTRSKQARAHHVGISPLHYGSVIAFSLRTRARPKLVTLAAIGSLSLGAVSAYGIWQLLTNGVSGLTQNLFQAGPALEGEALLLGIMYYVGRSLGQTAIVYGIAREADQRPVTLSRQFGVAINTFGRRLGLDIGYGFMEIALILGGVALFLTGGRAWPINSNLQLGLLFGSYLVILYLLSALAISRGLAGVNLALTRHRAGTAAKIGWKLFSHRIEIIGPRLGALLMELVLALPLVALGVVLVAAAPAQYHILVVICSGLLAWLAGALFGVGTAAWWSMLYRQLVLSDQPDSAVAMLSARQPEEARRIPLALIVAISTVVVSAALVLPWLKLA